MIKKEKTKVDNSNFQWTNKQIQRLKRFKENLEDNEKQNMMKKIVGKSSNSVQFYRILQRDQLPKYLQKMKFQTLHIKEKDLSKTIQLQKRQVQQPDQIIARKKLRNMGQIMYLSQIYHCLGESLQTNPYKQSSAPNNHSDLQSWQKNHNIKSLFMKKQTSKQRQASTRNSRISKCTKQDIEKLSIKGNEKFLVEKFRQGSDYNAQIQRSLEIIAVTHGSQTNIINKFSLIQNSVKLLKKQLDSKKLSIESEIKNSLKLLQGNRKQHHNLYLKRVQLQQEQKKLLQQLYKEETMPKMNKSYSQLPKIDKIFQFKTQRKLLNQKNELKIIHIKESIQKLELDIQKLQQKFSNIQCAQNTFYCLSLKSGIDCRESGLVWILKQIRQTNYQLDKLEFPSYMDKKSISFLINKCQNQHILENLLEQKKLFINEIGKKTNTNEIKHQDDPIKQIWSTDKAFQVPKKYRRSKKKITLLEQQYNQNQNLFQHSERKGCEISTQIQGLTGKQIYNKTQQRIKKFDLTKMKKQKLNNHTLKLQKYQGLLQKIKDIHIYLEQQQIQHQIHLISHYKDQKDLFFMQAAACFGVKKAYSLIIKCFSVKNAFKDT